MFRIFASNTGGKACIRNEIYKKQKRPVKGVLTTKQNYRVYKK